MESVNQHIMPRGNKWAVRAENSSRATRVFDTKIDAILLAREKAIRTQSAVVIHDSNGNIKDRDNYGPEPRSHRRKKRQ